MKNFKILFFTAVIILLIVGCSNNTKPENKEEETIVSNESNEEIKASKEEQEDIMKAYYKLLSSKVDKESLVKFIDENIGKLSEENADIIVIDLEELLILDNMAMREIYALLSIYKEDVSNEVKSYLSILTTEANDIFSDGEGIKVDLEEILNRALVCENHLKSYGKGNTIKKVYELYIAYIHGTIQGTGNPYIYAEDSSSVIKKDILQLYKSIISDNSNSKTGDILSQYVRILEDNNNDMNSEDVNIFYDNLNQIIIDTLKELV